MLPFNQRILCSSSIPVISINNCMLINELKIPFDRPVLNKIRHHLYHPPDKTSNSPRAYDYNDASEEHYKNCDSLQDKLYDLGWEQIGRGAFSSVFEKPGQKYVLKVNNYNDDGFAKFVSIIHHFPSRHFPKIGNKKSYFVDGEAYNIYLMEKLMPLQGANRASLALVLDNARIIDSPVILAVLAKHPDIKTIIEKQPGLLDAVEILLTQSGDSGLDLNSNNIMLRDDGTIVITDPLAW